MMKSLFAVAAMWIASVQETSAQTPTAPPDRNIPIAPMHSVPLSQSLARLVAEGWQIVGVSPFNRVFAYHLVRQGELAFCLSDISRVPPGTQCLQIFDGEGPSADTSPPPR